MTTRLSLLTPKEINLLVSWKINKHYPKIRKYFFQDACDVYITEFKFQILLSSSLSKILLPTPKRCVEELSILFRKDIINSSYAMFLLKSNALFGKIIPTFRETVAKYVIETEWENIIVATEEITQKIISSLPNL